MPNEFVLTMTAANRAGILSAVTRAMSELGGDLREISQTVVRGYFTMIFSAEFPDNLGEDIIRSHIEDTCRPFEIAVGLKCPATDGLPAPTADSTVIHTLRIGGDNRRGVLQDISSAISVSNADIVGMHAIRTRQNAGFEMVMKIAAPRKFDINQLAQAITSLARDGAITVDVTDAS
jgi:glycine cleavage system transcriptional repressor